MSLLVNERPGERLPSQEEKQSTQEERPPPNAKVESISVAAVEATDGAAAGGGGTGREGSTAAVGVDSGGEAATTGEGATVIC